MLSAFNEKIRNFFLHYVLKREKQLEYLEAHLVHHCNLNCAGCTHFSPLASKKWFADPKKYEKDLKRLAEFSLPMRVIRLMGGEPLLHPEAASFFKITRKYFKGRIVLVTNGVLLASMPKSFWQECRDNRVAIEISHYPVSLDMGGIKALASENQVKLYCLKIQKMFTNYLNSGPVFSPEKNFRRCKMALCNTLLEGKLYPCSLGTYINLFNKKFDAGFPEEKGLDIHKKGLSRKDILDYINSPISLCRYCTTKDIPCQKWKSSESRAEEWAND